jgi:hypothetical protein
MSSRSRSKVKEEIPPSLASYLVGGVLGVFIGAFLAIVYLVFTSPQVVAQMPEQTAPRTVYLLEANKTSAGPAFAGKRAALTEGTKGEYRLSEVELNQWVRASLTDAASEAGASGFITVRPGTPEFIVRDGALQVISPCDASAFGYSFKVRAQARGEVKGSAGDRQFEPAMVYLNSCPLPPGIGDYVLKRLASGFSIPDDLSGVWQKASAITVDGNALQVLMP